MTGQAWQERSPVPDTRGVLAELVKILDLAVALQPEIESVMRSCVADGPKGVALARTGHRIVSELLALGHRADRLPASPITDDARSLLRYHHRLLEETLQFAYDVSAVLDRRAARYFSPGLGAPAARLRHLRAVTTAYLSGATPDPSATSPLPAQFGHSLRTPLTGILGNASSLLQPDVDWDAESRQRFLRMIVSDSERLSRNIDNVLDLASIAGGTLRPVMDHHGLAVIVDEALDGTRAGLPAARSAQVSVDLTPVRRGVVRGDRRLLARALSNVIDNAVRHNPAGTPVRLLAVPHTGGIAISVIDTGRGLPPTVAAAVADALATGRLPTEVGTGIAASMGLVAAHGGTLRYEPVEGGTHCRIILPEHPTKRGTP